ncbi:MAG: ASCH domain-containing protein [Lachnospiraceae bacterium]|nr:ASCH domain-containing protein [Lachnospiraceae bacterium]
MTAEELWTKSGLDGEYEAWAFGGSPDELAQLVKNGIKTATCSAFCFYELEEEPLPQIGEYSIILDAKEEAVCIIRTTKVYVTAFDQVTKEHAFKEGKGDRSLEYWRRVHEDFFTEELQSAGLDFTVGMKVVCEEFKVVFLK